MWSPAEQTLHLQSFYWDPKQIWLVWELVTESVIEPTKSNQKLAVILVISMGMKETSGTSEIFLVTLPMYQFK